LSIGIDSHEEKIVAWLSPRRFGRQLQRRSTFPSTHHFGGKQFALFLVNSFVRVHRQLVDVRPEVADLLNQFAENEISAIQSKSAAPVGILGVLAKIAAWIVPVGDAWYSSELMEFVLVT